MDRDGLQSGFSVSWLADAFGLTTQTVRSRLADCPPKGQRGRGKVYDLKEAAPYLVEPKVDWERHLRGLKKTDLPVNLQKDVWEARIKEQKYLREAKDLWHTDDVLNLFTTLFLTVKSNVQLWPDNIERQSGLTAEQQKILIDLCDALLNDVYGEVRPLLLQGSTLSSVEQTDQLLESII